jgi:hypothetical protein
MPAPFGGNVKLGEYVNWAQTQGCSFQRGAVLDANGTPRPTIRIDNPAKNLWVIEVGTQLDEYIMPTTIARFDRRLGLKSPFFSIDAPDIDEG